MVTMPEGHSLHRLARALRRSFQGQRLDVTSPQGRFAAGAALGSALWFTALGLAARALAPVFARPGAWRVLDGLIAVVMTGVAAGLVLGN